MSNQENENPIHEKYYQILELKPDASFSEIKSSYLHLKKLYSSQSPVLSPIFDDISSQQNEALLTEIEEAYVYLKDYFATRETEKQKVTRDRVIHKNIPEFEVFSGNALKLTREVLGVELQEIALATGIPIKHLRNIEMERIDLLPPQGYVRIYITRYADYLSLDAVQVVKDYMKAMYKKKRH